MTTARKGSVGHENGSLPFGGGRLQTPGPVISDTDFAMVEKEFTALEAFLGRTGRLLTREFLIAEIWGRDHFGARGP